MRKNQEMEVIKLVSYADHCLLGKPENYKVQVEVDQDGVDDPLMPGSKIDYVDVITIEFAPEQREEVIKDLIDQAKQEIDEMAEQGLDYGDFYDNVPNVLHQLVQLGMQVGKPIQLKEYIQNLYKEAYRDYDMENDDIPTLEIWD